MIFAYKFTNFARCSSALEDDFKGVGMVDNIIDPPIKITRNVAWSYFNYDCDPNLDLNEHFQDQAKAMLKPTYVFLEPNSEDQCLDYFNTV